MIQNTRFKLSALALATAMACSPAAFATNGYFAIGYGTKAMGMAGVGVALPQDAIAAATNPAGMALIGSRADAGLQFFSPQRDGQMDASNLFQPAPPANPGDQFFDSGKTQSGATLFMVPNMGFAMEMAGMTMGLSIYGNGGMNTRYNPDSNNRNIYDRAFFGTGPGFSNGTLGVNLAQLIIAPTVGMKLNDSNALGASLLIGYQRFRAYGLGDFAGFGFSSDPSNMTNKGDDDAWGAGLRVGWTGNLTDMFTVGATASSRIYMQKFERYKGLFAEQGKFDIPANFAVGLAMKATPELTVAFDAQRILYGDIKAIANAGPTPANFGAVFSGSAPCTVGTDCLGDNGGFGFGWQNQTIYKLGVSYKYSDQLTLRGGVNYGKSPIPADQNLFNIVAPGVVEKHLTLGFTFAPVKNNEVSVGYMHAFRKDQSYVYNAGPAGTYAANIGMDQDALEVGYGIKF